LAACSLSFFRNSGLKRNGNVTLSFSFATGTRKVKRQRRKQREHYSAVHCITNPPCQGANMYAMLRNSLMTAWIETRKAIIVPHVGHEDPMEALETAAHFRHTRKDKPVILRRSLPELALPQLPDEISSAAASSASQA
jgi:hypothetical protein